MINLNPEGIKPEKQPPTASSFASRLTDIFSSLQGHTYEREKYTQNLLELKNLDQELSQLDFSVLVDIVANLQERIGASIGDNQDFNNKAFAHLEQDISETVTSIPDLLQEERKGFPTPSNPNDNLSDLTERHLPVVTRRVAKDFSEKIYQNGRNSSQKIKISSREMVSLGAALGHVATLQQQRLETYSQSNP